MWFYARVYHHGSYETGGNDSYLIGDMSDYETSRTACGLFDYFPARHPSADTWCSCTYYYHHITVENVPEVYGCLTGNHFASNPISFSGAFAFYPDRNISSPYEGSLHYYC